MENNLTKENAFSSIEAAHPKAYQEFIKWVEDYYIKYNLVPDVLSPGVTFFDLPLSFQMGLLLVFLTEMGLMDDGEIVDLQVNENVIESLDEMFKDLNDNLSGINDIASKF